MMNPKQQQRRSRPPSLPASPSTGSKPGSNNTNQALQEMSSDLAAIRSMMLKQQSTQVETIAKGVAYGVGVVIVIFMVLQFFLKAI